MARASLSLLYTAASPYCSPRNRTATDDPRVGLWNDGALE